MTNRHMSSALSESRHVKEDAERLAAAVRRARIEWQETLRERFRRRPYATIATAVGIGYVIGGGLVPGLLRPLAGAGGRIAVGLLLQRLLSGSMEDDSPNTETKEE
jgi:hypothetical protein